ncbi:MAG: hypothetical protein RIS47_1997 [Bacteroidota bacterium]
MCFLLFEYHGLVRVKVGRFFLGGVLRGFAHIFGSDYRFVVVC